MSVVRHYRQSIKNGKTVFEIFPTPQFIQGRVGWVDLDEEYADVKGYVGGGRLEVPPALSKKVDEYRDLVGHFGLNRVAEKIILETDQVGDISVSDRTSIIKDVESKCIEKKTVTRWEFRRSEETGEPLLGEDGHPLFDEIEEVVDVPLIPYERELVWVDGAENIPGVIVLPHDDYDRVYVLEGSKDAPEIRFINQHGLRPNYELAKFQRWFERRFGYIPTKQDIIDFNASLEEAEEPTSHEPFGQDTFDLFDADEAHREALEKSLLEEPPPRPYFTQPGDGKTYIYVSGFSGGAGTQADPYIIETVDELQDINQALSAHYVLGNDIDASGTRSWNDGAGFVAIGIYQGTLDGRGYKISDLYTTEKNVIIYVVGLLKNVFFENVIICGSENHEWIGTSLINGISGSVIGCGVTGSISGLDDFVSGFCFASEGLIENCYSLCDVTGPNPNIVSGFASFTMQGSMFKNCYSAGALEGNIIVGFVYGMYGGTVVDCYWDKDASGAATSSGGIGKTTAEMMSQSTFTNWDFTDTWWIKEGETYPGLWNAGGYPITNVTELQAMKNKLDGIYYLANDIDASDTVNWNSGAGWELIGEYLANFKGRLDGKGYIINNLYMNQTEDDPVSFLGTIDGALIKNLGLTNIDYYGNNVIGGFAYQALGESVIESCFIAGVVVGENAPIGGFIYRMSGGIIKNCYTDVSITNTSPPAYAGGFIAEACYGARLENCYAVGVMTNGQGFCGFQDYEVESDKPTFVSCYWDTQATGRSGSDGGTGKTTAQMKTQSTYTGWDFTNIWGMDSAINDGYPHLLVFGYEEEPPVGDDKTGTVVVSGGGGRVASGKKIAKAYSMTSGSGSLVWLGNKNALEQATIIGDGQVLALGKVAFPLLPPVFSAEQVGDIIRLSWEV